MDDGAVRASIGSCQFGPLLLQQLETEVEPAKHRTTTISKFCLVSN
jgi:hypothetical protein